MSKVSILLPTYNRERYLVLAIDSVLAQTHQDWELLISDNCSDDNTFTIASKYANQDSRIIYWKNETNIGALQNYNRCIEKACGDYIELFGTDDIFEPTCLELLARGLDENPGVALATSAKRHIDENGNQIREDRLASNSQIIPAQEAIHHNLNNLTNAIISPVMFRSKYKGTGFDMSLGNCADLEYWTQILNCGDLYYIDEILFNYRIHNGSETTRTLADLQFAVLLLRIAERNKEHLFRSDQPGLTPYKIVVERLMDIIDYSTNYLKLDFSSFVGSLGHAENEQKLLSYDNLHDFKKVSYLSLMHAVDLRHENKVLQKRIDELSTELNSLHNSKSWKITAPLRMVMKMASVRDQ
jgi:glycosyltransferase involved in cell wall biosynthesis